ncbi:FMN-binding negative transcriptional regulator [Rhodophyticola sp. CCM32]|uniref:FMN-binding negative transcriptional regulator n=1 Tax=Rhodophyticola sp. CCM32 TaxID=2916397 RepID=UPI00107F03FB|nr:FMN-binding negative transcriptional regulator [Rhodophyticola sp. CCM32]QBY01891.1 FMN-binding negative transcriptional regulator [Rhodophyticola sp. CCM32]
MHPNPAYRGEPQARNLSFARARGFGALSINAEPAPLISHIPFVLNADGTEAGLHLLRSNPIARAVTAPTPAVIAVTGPDGYISPDWYGDPAQVPTWNYVAVHLRGHLHPMDHGQLRAELDRLAARFEAELLPKPPWTTDKMPEDALNRMMRTILPFRFEITDIDGTWKLNQTKSATVREAAAAEVSTSPIGQETGLLSSLMLAVNDPE